MRIDFLISGFTDNELILHSPFKYFTPEVVGEFKSETDFFGSGDFFATIAKLHYYLAARYGYMGSKTTGVKIDPMKLSAVFIISGNRSIPNLIEKKYSPEILERGVYRISTTTFNSVLIILSKEIKLTTHNYFLGLFVASRIDEFLKIAVSMSDNFMLTIAHMLFKEIVGKDKKAMEVLNRKGFTIKESVEALGISRVVNEVGVESVVDAVGIESVIDAVGIESVIDAVGIESVVDAVGIESVIDAVGVEKVIDAVGVEKVIDIIGVEDVINEVGLENVLEEVKPEDLVKALSNEKKEKLRKLLE